MNSRQLLISKVILFLLVLSGVLYIFRNYALKKQLPEKEVTPIVKEQEFPNLAKEKYIIEVEEDPMLGYILIDANGNTLYTYAQDTAGVSTCLGSCLEQWPPFLVSNVEQLTAPIGIAPDLAVLTRADGTMQVSYQGKPLYYYTGDLEPGDNKGHNYQERWFTVSVQDPYLLN